MITEEQRKARIKSIGSSDCAGVLGLSRWSSPLKIWAIKTGTIIEEDISDKFAIKWGTELEDTVAKVFSEETGKKLYRVNETVVHPVYDFLTANLDRRVVGEKSICECKTTDSRNYREWDEDSIPQEIILQCYHQLAVTGWDKCYVAVAIGNREFKWKEIVRDEKVISDIVKREVSFWTEYVLPKIPPKVITKNDSDTIDKMFPQATNEEPIELPDEANKLIESIESLDQDKKNLEGLIEKQKNELKMLLGKSSFGTTSVGHEVKWTNSRYSAFNTKMFSKIYPDIYKNYYESKPIRRFQIKICKK